MTDTTRFTGRRSLLMIVLGAISIALLIGSVAFAVSGTGSVVGNRAGVPSITTRLTSDDFVATTPAADFPIDTTATAAPDAGAAAPPPADDAPVTPRQAPRGEEDDDDEREVIVPEIRDDEPDDESDDEQPEEREKPHDSEDD